MEPRIKLGTNSIEKTGSQTGQLENRREEGKEKDKVYLPRWGSIQENWKWEAHHQLF